MPDQPTEDNLAGDLIDAVNAHVIDVLRVGSSIRREVLSLLKALEVDLSSEIDKNVGNKDLNWQRLTKLLTATRATIKDAYTEIEGAHTGQLATLARASVRHVVTAVNDAVKVELMAATFNKAEFQAMAKKTIISGRYLDEWWARQGQTLQDRFTVQMRLGMLQGESVGDLVRRLRGTKVANFADGLMQMPRYQAEALVRTSVIAISNAARLQSFTQNADLIKGVQWVATLDQRGCEMCIAIDGLMWTLPESGDIEDYAGYKPIGHNKNFPGVTLHPNCRCSQVAVMESFEDLASKKGVLGPSRFDDIFKQKLIDKGFSEEEAAGIEANTRASMDGQVGTDGGYEKWLNSKDAAFQDELLGNTAGKLWRAGKIDLTDITNTDNRPLSAADLLAKFE
jgi:hypothetical protein